MEVGPVALHPVDQAEVRRSMMALQVVCKIVRFIMIVLVLNQFVDRGKYLGNVALVGNVVWFRNPYITTEWTLQVIDNA